MTGIITDNVGRTSGLIKASSGGGGGVWTKIKTQTASSSSTIDFLDGTSDVVLDSSYPIYVFKFINCHPSNDQTNFQFQANVSGGSGFNETMTTSTFQAQHSEGGSSELSYESGMDQSQGTGFQRIAHEIGNGNDESTCGELWLFGLSSTTFTKHFLAKSQSYRYNDYSHSLFTAGYFNTTSAIDEIQFAYSAGTIDSGQISLFGIKDSA
tara:strand:+ start:1311 stop:1940 length:630 start_codon:yes stop_codon:yes gene_type:complete